MSFAWTENAIATAKRRWIDGASASAIAAELGGGLTRSGVIGKLHRLGITRADQPTKPKADPRPARHAPSAPPRPTGTVHEPAHNPSPIPESETPAETTGPVPFLATRAWHCRWIVSGEEEPPMCCGARALAGRSYCLDHMRRATRPADAAE